MQLILLIKTWRYSLACALLLFPILNIKTAFAEDITPFRLTGVDGELSLRHIHNELIQDSESGDHNRSEIESNEAGLSFITHSYIFHPKFLEIDLGAGIHLHETHYENAGGDVKSEGELDSVTARMSFFKDKSYPFFMYFDRINPVTHVSNTESFVSQNEKYGVNASLLEPLIPFSINLEAFKETSVGEGATQVVNQTNDQMLFRAYKTLDDNSGHVQLTYHNRQQVSESGLRSALIQKTDRQSESTSLDSDILFGDQKQIRLVNLFSHYTQDSLPQQKEFRWAPNLTWQHTDSVKSFYYIDYSDNEVDGVESKYRSGSIGVHLDATERLEINGQVNGIRSDTLGLSAESNGASGSIGYNYLFDTGKLQLTYSTAYDQNENQSPSDESIRQNERLIYNGVVNRLQLSRPYVINVTNVAVERNGVIVFSSVDGGGVDYSIENDGVLTFIVVETRANPAEQKILPDDILLVTYTYQTGGDISFSTSTNKYSAYLTLLKYYSVYANYSDTEHQVDEGISTIPLNSTRYSRVGAKVDRPFDDDKFRLSVESIYEKQDENISPYVRRTIDTSFQLTLTNRTSLRLTARQINQDNDRANSQDIDLFGKSVAFSTQLLPASHLRLEYRDDEDTGGAEKRRIRKNLIQFRMRIRKLKFTIDGSTVDEQFGGYTRHYNSITANLIRTF